MDRGNRDREKQINRNHEQGFRQSHGGRDSFPGGEWGASQEFGKNTNFRESDSYDRPYDMDNFKDSQFSGKGFAGIGPKGYKRSDERIREDVCEVLFRNPSVDASDIEVAVKEGLVTLSGTVDSRFAKREAEGAIEHLGGVVDVRNELSLRKAH